MKTYNSYKKTDIEWLGEIPVHWEVKRVKDLGYYQSGNFIDANEMNNQSPYPVFGGNGIRGYAEKYNLDGAYVLIGRQGALCGNINYARGKFWATEHAVVVYNKNEYNLTWLGELFKIMNFNQYSLSAAQPGLSVDRIKRLELPIPSKEERTAIVQYLDSKTQAIDQKTRLLQKKIDYYKELRKSIINDAVTKGLDNNGELKENDFGFKTPMDWTKKRLKDLGTLYSGLSGKSGDDFNQDDNPNNKGFIPFTNIANNTYLQKDNLGTVVVSDGERQNEVRKGDIFFLMSSEGYGDIGKSAVLAEELKDTYLNSFCRGFRINQKTCNPYFLNYLLLSDYYRQILIIEGKGFTRINLKMEKINDFEVYLPLDLDIQFEIVTYLDQKTQTIDKIIANIQKQKTVLKEFRKTLINEVVTGKKRVYEPKSSAVV